MKPVRVAMVGAGGISRAHLRAISTIEEMEVVAIADIVRERAEEKAKEWNIPHVYEDYKEMIDKEDVEAVNVTTYHMAHAAPTIYALKAGKHVIVEKPMAATLEDATAMTKAAKESGKILMVALKARYSDHRIAAQMIADSGVLGDIYYAECGGFGRVGPPGGSFIRKETAGVGVTADWGVYSLDEILCLMHHPKPVAVSGIANNLVGRSHKPVMGGWKWVPEDLEVEDFGAAWVRFENGAAMVFKAAWIAHIGGLTGPFILGTKAGLKLSPLTVFRHEWGLMTDTIPQNISETDPAEQFRRENVAFAKAIREGLPSPIPPEELLLTNVIIQGLIDSAKVGHEIPVTVPEI